MWKNTGFGYGERKRGHPGAVGCFQMQVLCWPLPRLLSQAELCFLQVKEDKHSLWHGLYSNQGNDNWSLG